MDNNEIEAIVQKSGRKISFFEWLFMKKQQCISLDVPRSSFDFLNDTIQTT